MAERADMKIADIMRKEAVVVDERSTVAEVARVLVACNEDLAVVCTKGKPLGVVTSYDITSHLGKGGSPKKWVSRIMTSPVMSVTPYEDVEQALQHMETQRLRKYPVIMGNRVMGMISVQDMAEKQNAHIRFHRGVQTVVILLFVAFEISVFALAFWRNAA